MVTISNLQAFPLEIRETESKTNPTEWSFLKYVQQLGLGPVKPWSWKFDVGVLGRQLGLTGKLLLAQSGNLLVTKAWAVFILRLFPIMFEEPKYRFWSVGNRLLVKMKDALKVGGLI